MDLLPLALISICVIFLLSKLGALWKFVKFIRQVDNIPGPGNFYSIGLLIKFMKMPPQDRLTWFVGVDKEFNGFFKFWAGTDPMVYVRNPKHLETILTSTVNIKKGKTYQFGEPWLGQGLLTSAGEKWHRDRRLLGPAFHFNILEQFAVVMNRKAQIFVNCLENEIKKKKPGEPINVFNLANKCTLDIMCETAMGVDIHAQEIDSGYGNNVQRIIGMMFHRMFSPWRRIDFIYYLSKEGKEFKKLVAELHKFTEDVIQARKLARMQKPETNEENTDNVIGTRKQKAFLDLLLDENANSNNPMTDKELREQVDTFMFTGHDTTGAAISWTLFCIGNEPEVQEKMHQELDRVFGDSKEIATIKQLSELKYLDRIIKEALRLYPSAPDFMRDLQTDVEINGYLIPKESTLSVSPFVVHRDPEYWPDPLKFDPDRFLPENMVNRHRYAYIPFSAGPRNCIGQKFAHLEAKIILTAVLRKFRLKSMQKYDEISLCAIVILKPLNGINLQLTPKY